MRQQWGTRNAARALQVAQTAEQTVRAEHRALSDELVRRGLTPQLTIEAHGEGSRGLFMAGVGGVIGIGEFAVANVSAAGSTISGRNGAQISAGIQHIGQRFSFGVSAIFASHDYSDVAAANGERVPQLQGGPIREGGGEAAGRGDRGRARGGGGCRGR